ncbi:MAG TPA: trigger factor [Ruminococcaceae bacterium]|nr:trigger factor [Oscillospiraceae bacterium]
MEVVSNNKTGTNTVELEVKVGAEDFEKALQEAYLRRRKNIQIDGFRKGKATRKMIEAKYGESFFYETAINSIYQRTVAEAIEDQKLDAVDIPDTKVTDVSRENGVTFVVTVTVKPEITISGYKGLKAEKTVKTVTDEEVDAEVERIRNNNARIIDVEDRPAQLTDTVIFDFEGSVDGKTFDGGKAEKFSLELGSGRFIPGFEDQVAGHSIGEDFDVNVTFPEDYNVKELAGKAAVFKCKIHEIKGKELADLDDEFAKDVSEFDTLAEYKADLKKNLQERADKRTDGELDNTISEELAKLVEGEIPDAMTENRVNDMLREWEYRNRYAGVTIKDYLKYTGLTMDQFRATFKEPAATQVKLRLALEKIAELENIEVSEDELEKQYQELADEHKQDIAKVKELISTESLTQDIKVEKAFKFVKENAEITEKAE